MVGKEMALLFRLRRDGSANQSQQRYRPAGATCKFLQEQQKGVTRFVVKEWRFSCRHSMVAGGDIGKVEFSGEPAPRFSGRFVSSSRRGLAARQLSSFT